MIFSADQLGPYKFPGFHPPTAKRLIGLILRPPTWAANTVYGKRNESDRDVLIPTVFKGFYFEVVNPGKSLATEPDYVNEEGEETYQEGTSLVLRAKTYNLLPVDQNIDTVTVEGNHGVTVSGIVFTYTNAYFMVDPLPAEAIAAKEFTLTATVTLDNTEVFPVDIEFRVG